jgi:DNA-binding NtrC family response regulator
MTAERTRALVVDDDESLRRVMARQLADAGHDVVAAASAEEALAHLAEGGADLLVTDQRMPGMDGLRLLAEAKRLDPDLAVVVVTAHGNVGSAVEAMRLGATDYLEKPFPREALLLAAEKALRVRDLERANVRLRQELVDRYSYESLVGGSVVMKDVFRTIARVSASSSPVLVRGESGTGKELVARAIHYASARARGPFVPVNCSAIPEGLLEPELFGHARGAFTGAVRRRRGRFEEADGGTLFLDEIGELHPALQAKLLRVLQDGEVRPVGDERSVRTDVRLVAATNRDLEAAMEEGAFREDLYYRIAVLPLRLPPLRERRDDVPLLVAHLLAKKGQAGIHVDSAVVEALRAYAWPGNVRELENVLERALVLRRQPDRMTLEDLPEEILRPAAPAGALAGLAIPEEGLSLAAVERDLIAAALSRTGGNQTRAAKLLGITRQTLIYRMGKHGLAGDGGPEGG